MAKAPEPPISDPGEAETGNAVRLVTRLRGRAVLAAAVAAFLVGSGVVALFRAATEATPNTSFFNLGFDPTDPSEELLQPGRQVTLEEASATTGVGLIRPQHTIASDASLSEVWLGESGDTEVGLRYDSGLRAYITVWPAGGDPAAFYGKLASVTDAGRYQTINGFPAWVFRQMSRVLDIHRTPSLIFRSVALRSAFRATFRLRR